MTDRTRIEECLTAYGADLSRWPAGEAAAARALGDDAGLAARRADEAWLDAALADWPAMWADPARIEALLSTVAAMPVAGPVNAGMAVAPSRLDTIRQRYALTGGALLAVAASIAAVLLIAPPRETTPVTLTDEAALAMMFSTELSEGWSEGWM